MDETESEEPMALKVKWQIDVSSPENSFLTPGLPTMLCISIKNLSLLPLFKWRVNK